MCGTAEKRRRTLPRAIFRNPQILSNWIHQRRRWARPRSCLRRKALLLQHDPPLLSRAGAGCLPSGSTTQSRKRTKRQDFRRQRQREDLSHPLLPVRARLFLLSTRARARIVCRVTPPPLSVVGRVRAVRAQWAALLRAQALSWVRVVELRDRGPTARMFRLWATGSLLPHGCQRKAP